jgi:hypothetical protein
VKRLLVFLFAFGLAMSACSKEKAAEGPRVEQPCATRPITNPNLPSSFPAIDDVIWTASHTAGGMQVVNGHTDRALAVLFEEMKEKFSGGGYSAAKSERDLHHAEVNFDGAKYNGQVALTEECNGRTSMRITIRRKS